MVYGLKEDEDIVKQTNFYLTIVNLVLTFLLMSVSSSGFVISLCKVELLNTRRKVFCQALGMNYAFMTLGSYNALLVPT